MSGEVLGRDREQAIIQAFLDRPLDGPRAMVLEGDAGIGKSTLWLAGLEAAGRRFAYVLASRPAESERSFADVILGDLFGETSQRVLAAIPAPRRRAFEQAVLLTEAGDKPVHPRALAAAVQSILAKLTADGPLLLAIDDDQWADRSSAAALSFALRRLSHAPIRLLLARRVSAETSEGSGLDRATEAAAGPESIERVHIGPLSIGAIQALLRSRLGLTPSRPKLVRLVDASGGNPFFALELARAQPARADSTAPLVVPANLERLLAVRFDNLDEAARRALLIVAANGRTPLPLLQRLHVSSKVIDAAGADQVLDTSGGLVRFSHPLLASVVGQRAGPAELRAVHLELAHAIDDRLGGARHLALGTTAPDDAVAADLESAAAAARIRGLLPVAAELAEHALRLTPEGRSEDTRRRRAIAARAYVAAGDLGPARRLAAAQLAEAPGGALRAEALILAAHVEDNLAPAAALLEQALEEAPSAPAAQAEAHLSLAEALRYLPGFHRAAQHVMVALELAEQVHDDRLRIRCLAVLSVLRFESHEPNAIDLAREAHRRALLLGDPEVTYLATWAVGHQLTGMRRIEEARAWLEAALDTFRWDELIRASCLHYLAMVELWAGTWDSAWAYAEEAAEIDAEYGVEQPHRLWPRAMVALHRGEFAIAREQSARAIALPKGELLEPHVAVLGVADLWSGRPAAALAQLVGVQGLAPRHGVRENGLWIWRADYVEALLQLGRIQEAAAWLAEWEDAAIGAARDWNVANLIRSKGLLAAATGELDTAVTHLEEAARRHEACGDRFGWGRALLALGQVRRRQRQKRLSRDSLEGSLTLFEALGATSFVAAALSELGRLGGRQRQVGLSPSERRVAALVAEGRTNREIASALFLGQRTVESHLRHIYSKLGIRSRTELARHQLVRDELMTNPTKVPQS